MCVLMRRINSSARGTRETLAFLRAKQHSEPAMTKIRTVFPKAGIALPQKRSCCNSSVERHGLHQRRAKYIQCFVLRSLTQNSGAQVVLAVPGSPAKSLIKKVQRSPNPNKSVYKTSGTSWHKICRRNSWEWTSLC